MSIPDFPRRYIGDGVYCSFDGYQIWLAVNHRENNVVALEPAVFENLVAYSDEIARFVAAWKEQLGEENNDETGNLQD